MLNKLSFTGILFLVGFMIQLGFAQSVGIGTSTFTPGSMLSVDGNVSIGNGYRATANGVTNGLIVEGNVSIGTSTAGSKLVVKGTGATSGTTAVTITNSTPTTLFTILNDGNVGINSATPAQKLNVVGTVRISTATNGTASSIITSNTSGDLSYVNFSGSATDVLLGNGTFGGAPASSSGWATTGNASLTDGTHFIGTTDDVDLNFKVNNVKSGRIDNNLNNTFFGYSAGLNWSATGQSANVAIGSLALSTQSYSTTFASGNTAVGYEALRFNQPTATTNGRYNTAIGYDAIKANTTGNNNTAVGLNALAASTTSNDNVAIGEGALQSLTTVSHRNTAVGTEALVGLQGSKTDVTGVGYQAGNSSTGVSGTYVGSYAGFNIVGNNNTALGYQAMYGAGSSAATGQKNVAVGYQALYSLTSGADNAAFGYQSLYTNTSGSGNFVAGQTGLYNNTIGSWNFAWGYFPMNSAKEVSQNIAIGYLSQYYANDGTNLNFGSDLPTHNIALGYQSLRGSTTAANNIGTYNVAIGKDALLTYTSGANNIAIGQTAMDALTSGSKNIAIGQDALGAVVTADENVAVGYFALKGNTYGAYNIAIGSTALNTQSYANGNSNYTSANVAVGYNALTANQPTSSANGIENTALGYNTLTTNTTGYDNTAVGAGACSGTHTTGFYNTFVGAYTASNAAGNSNSTALGKGATVTASNYIALGNTSVATIAGQVAHTTYSDGRVKNNVQENVVGLKFINSLRPVTYHYDIDKENEIMGVSDKRNWEGKYDVEKIQFSGFIAQEVDAAAKRVGYNFSGVDKNGALWGLRYSDFVVPLVKATQELDKKDKNLEEKINTLLEQNLALQAELNKMKSASSVADQTARLNVAEQEIKELKSKIETLLNSQASGKK